MKFTLILFFCLILSSTSCSAMCFQSPTPCEWYAAHHGQPTFIGTALSKETVPDALQLGEKVTFRVEEPFADVPEKTVDIYGFGTTNDFHFQVGTKYLVYAFRGKDGKIRTAKCTRTAPVSDAAEDINFLRSLPTRNGGGIRGLIRFVSPGVQIGTLAGTITASGIGGDHKQRVAASGQYELNGLAPGEYRETFTPDHDSTEFISLKLRIPVNGSCAGSGVRLGNLTVSGRAINHAGTPVAGQEMLLFYALDDKFHPEVALTTRTDRNGTFSFHRVEAAKYILVAQSDLGAIFFPGTRDASKAQILELHDGKPLSGVTVDLPLGADSWEYRLDDSLGKIALYPGQGYRSYVREDEMVSSLDELERRVGLLPKGTRLYWRPFSFGSSGQPILFSDGQSGTFEKFCRSHGKELIVDSNLAKQ